MTVACFGRGSQCQRTALCQNACDLRVQPAWPHDASDRVHELLGQIAAKELECQRLREALNFIATHFSTEWPERCQSNVLAARNALSA